MAEADMYGMGVHTCIPQEQPGELPLYMAREGAIADLTIPR